MRARWRLGSRFAGLNGNDNAVELRDGEVDLFPLLIAQPPYAGHERQHLISPTKVSATVLWSARAVSLPEKRFPLTIWV